MRSRCKQGSRGGDGAPRRRTPGSTPTRSRSSRRASPMPTGTSTGSARSTRPKRWASTRTSSSHWSP